MLWLKALGSTVLRLLTGGSLDKLLETVNKRFDAGVKRDEIKAEVTKKWIEAQSNLLVGRTWWFQLFFVLPLGMWWTAVILDSIFGWEHDILALPTPLDEWAGWIISALFIVDGGKALIGRFK